MPTLAVGVEVVLVVVRGVAFVGSVQGLPHARHSCLQPAQCRAQLNTSAVTAEPRLKQI